MKRYAINFIFLILCSAAILYPKNIKELFYYDDNPIRYMVAKMFVDGRLSREDKMFFISYGSSEIYLPFFFIAKHIKAEYQITYNIVSLIFFVLCISYISFIFRKDEGNLKLVTYIMTLLGIICVKKGSIHWLISSTIFLSTLLSTKLSITRFLLMGLAYLISPTLIITSIIFSIIFLVRGEKKRAIFLISPFLMILPKTIIISEMTLNEIRELISLDSITSRKISETIKPTIPASFYAFLRFFSVDYVDNKISAILITYIISARAIFLTKHKKALFIFALFYILVGFSIAAFKIWGSGLRTWESIIISIFGVLFVSNPFRHAPIIVSYLIATSDVNRYDKIINKAVIFILVFWSITNLIKGKGELPEKVPYDVKNLIEFLNNSEIKNILIEGDTHILEKWKLIHPIYNSHIVSYIVAETENKKFYGGIIPWDSFKFNFIAGKFKSKPIHESDIKDFIKEKNIDMVVCWTNKCKNFFRNSGEIDEFGFFLVVTLERQK